MSLMTLHIILFLSIRFWNTDKHCGYIGERTFLLNSLALAARIGFPARYSTDIPIHLGILSQVSAWSCRSRLTPSSMMLQSFAAFIPLNPRLTRLQPEPGQFVFSSSRLWDSERATTRQFYRIRLSSFATTIAPPQEDLHFAAAFFQVAM